MRRVQAPSAPARFDRMRALRGTLLLVSLLALVPAASAITAETSCPADPTKCNYARATLEVGPLTVTAEASVEGGSSELEANVTAHAGDAGTLTFTILANTSSSGETFVVTLRMNETSGIEWTEGTEREVSFVAQAGFPVRESVSFRIAKDAAPATYPLAFVVDLGNATGTSAVGVTVVALQETSNDAPGAPVALVLVGLAALALARRRG